MKSFPFFILLLLVFLLQACGGGSSSDAGGGINEKTPTTDSEPEPEPEPEPGLEPDVLYIEGANFDDPDATLQKIIAAYSLSGDPADGAIAVRPSQDPMVRLGQLLFFSKSLSLDFETACASCHHAEFAGGDDLSLPVGVSAITQHHLGPGRIIDAEQDLGPFADGGPNVPRNSQTILNVSLYRDSMFWDGRIFRMEEMPPPNGASIAIRTPDSGNNADAQAGNSLLEAQARFPVISPDEMRGYHHSSLITASDVRERLVARFRGLADGYRMTDKDATRWLKRFREAYQSPAGTSEDLVTFQNIQTALAKYQASQIFVDSPWNRFVKGYADIDEQAKTGAMLFYLGTGQGGLACVSCHSGDHFTSEQFYNVGFPQFGHGKDADRRDFGRFLVTNNEADRFTFRVPSLINVAATGPWGHTGAFDDLPSLLDYHSNPVAAVDYYDFTLSGLAQFQSGEVAYPHAEKYTREAVSAANLATDRLPGIVLSEHDKAALVSFLETLTDDKVAEVAETGSCASAVGCPTLWTPLKYETDADGEKYTDGNTLFLGEASLYDGNTPPSEDSGYPKSFELAWLSAPERSGFADLASCSPVPSAKGNTGSTSFTEKAATVGLTDRHGYSIETWVSDDFAWFETLIMSGGISGGYVDGDCWPDLIFAGGDTSGLQTYLNISGDSFQANNKLDPAGGAQVSGVMLVDINGDYRREWVMGNTRDGQVSIINWDDSRNPGITATLPMSRNTFGMSFGDYNNDGYLEAFLGHWGLTGLPGTAPAFWHNQAGEQWMPMDGSVGLSTGDGVNQSFNFSPAFADFNGSGWQDLVIASDFGTSYTLTNDENADATGRYFRNVTDRGIISDENGMGQAVADIDNDGRLDWFVSSIFDPNGSAEGNWGVTGNRLYRNISQPGDDVRFSDITEQAGVADGGWGWGACIADFNNDGWKDIFHVNGFGYIPEDVRNEDTGHRIDSYKSMAAEFIDVKPRLFINNGDGGFVDQTEIWGFGPDNGRGIVCFDYDRDGDIDIAIADSSSTPKFYENQIGHGEGNHFVSVRLQGLPPNTDAIGARVTVVADLDGDGTINAGETQTRVAQINSNYVSQNPPDLHFGLGSASAIQSISVTWPGGNTDTSCQGAPINRFMTFREGEAACMQ